MDPNYFTCTLGQAAALGIQQPHKTINTLIDALAAECPDKPAVAFPRPGAKPEDPWSNLLFTFKDVKAGSEYTAARLLHDNKHVLSERQTVGLICPSTSDFLFTWLALMRLGHAVLLIAPQCQPPAIANLCKTCEVGLLFYDDAYWDLAREAAATSTQDVGWRLEAAGLPFPEQPSKTSYLPDADGEVELPAIEVREDEVAYLHHTSGTSSGMPKPIPQTHRAGVGVLPTFSDRSTAATFTTTPLYHGGIADLFRAWTSQALIYLFPGKRVPITSKNIIRCLNFTADAHQKARMPPVKYFSSVPYVLQTMEADPNGVEWLQTMAVVGVGGAVLPAEVGDRLVAQHVNLISRFGSAECGFLLSSHREYRKAREWQHLRVASGAEKYIRFEPQEVEAGSSAEQLAELVVLEGWPHMAKRNRPDGSYATSDLFARHPSIEGAWRYHSRADSQLTLVTGKKFDPAPLEDSLSASTDLLDDVLIFGNGKAYPGVLLFRGENARGFANEDEELVNQIWPVVERLNEGSQEHARIARNMLVSMRVLEKPLEKSSKGTILRGVAEKRFQLEIEKAYSQVEGDDSTDNVPDEKLPEEIRQMVSSSVAKRGKLEDTTELFAYGVDSVAGMRIRAKLRRLVPADGKALPINVVEDCGTVERLVEYVRSRRRGEAESNGIDHANQHEYMRELVEQYSKFDPNGKSTANVANGHTDGEVVVLTGATGALGAHILDQYRKQAKVRKIYCLVRGADEHASRERVNKALLQRKLQPLDSDEKVTVLQASLSETDLGLSPDMYELIAREATIIMHVAWSVNFRMKLRSFVRDNIAGVTHLVNLALASSRDHPPRFAFCSSVASAMAYIGKAAVPEEIIDDPAATTELGYSQSKWVAEQICHRAAMNIKLKGRVSIFRVGQLAGDSVHGIWNTKEAWPMMLSAVKVTGSLPKLAEEKLDWLPVDLAARALIEGSEAECSSGTLKVYHVLNDSERPTWDDLLQWLRKTTSFEVVPPARWVEQLEDAVNNGSQHPASQLLDHWKQAYAGRGARKGKSKESGHAKFEMDRTKGALPALRMIQPVDDGYVGKLWKWIEANV